MENTTNYLDRLSFEAIFSRAFHIFGKRWQAFFAIAISIYVLGWMFAIFMALVLGADIEIDGFSMDTATAQSLQTGHALVIYILECIIYYCFCCIAHGAAIWLVAHLYLHQQQTIQDAFQKGLERLFALLASTFLIILFLLAVAILVMLAAINIDESLLYPAIVVLMVLNVCVAIVTYLIYPAIMVENQGAIGSIKRSWNLTEGHRCTIFGFFVLCFLVKFMLGCLLAALSFQAYPFTDNVALYYLCKTIDTLMGMAFMAIGPVFQGVIYMHIRVVKEELSYDKLANEIGIMDGNYITMNTIEEGSATTGTAPVAASGTNNATATTDANEPMHKAGVVA